MTEAERVIALTNETDPTIRERIVEAVREHGFKGAAARFKLKPRELASLVCARGVDLVSALREK